MDEIWSLDILSIYVCSMLWVSNILKTFVSCEVREALLDFTWHASQLHMSHSFCLSLHLRSVDLYLFLFKSRPCGHLVGLCPTCLFYSLRHGRLGLIEVFPFILLFTKVFPLVTNVYPFSH